MLSLFEKLIWIHVFIIGVIILFLIVQAWNKYQDQPDSYRIKTTIGILFVIPIPVCMFMLNTSPAYERESEEAIIEVMFLAILGLWIWCTACILVYCRCRLVKICCITFHPPLDVSQNQQ